MLRSIVLTGAAKAGLEVVDSPRVGVRVEGEIFMLRVKEWSRKLDVPVERPGGSTYYWEYTRAEGTGRLELRLEGSPAPLPRLR